MKALNHHSRQNSYANMTLDMGNNRIVNTDPLITKYFKRPKVRNIKNPVAFPPGVVELLLHFEPNIPQIPVDDFDDHHGVIQDHPYM